MRAPLRPTPSAGSAPAPSKKNQKAKRGLGAARASDSLSRSPAKLSHAGLAPFPAPFCFAVSTLASAAFAADAPRGAGGLWYRYPLPGAEVKSLVADPAVAGLYWAGTAQGGIYRSSDWGASWQSPPEGLSFPDTPSRRSRPIRSGAALSGRA